ncbi:MAG: type II toxin-antitoxin system RelE/ParE family toxin [Bacteroidetes bacterium]|nr:type II toxin-antitoxin system RelE/ParE family toxin [Bacteroidota bacterium]
MKYHLVVKPSARKELEKIEKNIRIKIVDAIDLLTLEPRPIGCKKLTSFDNAYRIRVSNFRIVYKIYDKELVVEVIKVADRKDVYR